MDVKHLKLDAKITMEASPELLGALMKISGMLADNEYSQERVHSDEEMREVAAKAIRLVIPKFR